MPADKYYQTTDNNGISIIVFSGVTLTFYSLEEPDRNSLIHPSLVKLCNTFVHFSLEKSHYV